MKASTKSEVKTKKSQRPSQLSKSVKKVKEVTPAKAKTAEPHDFIFPEQGKWMTESLLKLLSKWNIISVGLALGYFAVFYVIVRIIETSIKYAHWLHSVLWTTLPSIAQAWLNEVFWNFQSNILSGIYIPAAFGIWIFLILFIGSQWANYKRKSLTVLGFIVMFAIFLRLALALLPYTELFLKANYPY